MPPFINFRKYAGSAALVVQAHTDDADFNCGATVCRLAEAGAKVVYVVCTKGEKGTVEPDFDPDELTRTRRGEQLRANEILGVENTVFLDYPDGELRATLELQEKLTALIREHRPKLLFTFDPSRPEHEMHPDHRACAVAALRANAFSGMPNYFPGQIRTDGLAPWQCGEILLYDPPRRADTFVPVGGRFRRKLDALLAHESQLAHLLTGDQKKLVDTLLKIPVDAIVQAVAGALAHQFIIERFRSMRAKDLLK